ncbi:MAG: MBOAT family O-acyltransferase, partial [Gemmatimonadaceae bacterium]
MLFTTYSYFVFLLLAVAGHWLLRAPVARAIWLIVCSLTFYVLTQGLFVLVLLAYVLFNWWAGLRLAALKERGSFLRVVLLANLLPLLYYKYWPTFLQAWFPDNEHVLLAAVPLAAPLGISFFAFQASAYLVDVSRGGVAMTSLLDFTLFKTFWAQLVAGPIVRASELRDQLRVRTWDTAASIAACGRIVNGLTKKIVFSDLVAPFANQAFQAAHPTFLDALFGTLAFGLQIYFDFSAYSDIAIGSAQLLGFKLPENFNWPYSASSPQEFWQRWHMTLSRWIRDYVFMPLTMHYRRNPIAARGSIVLAMALCGVWHGAGWTFLLWGLWHGLLLAANATFMRGFFRPTQEIAWRRWLAWAVTFAAVQVSWIFFRAESVSQISDFLTALFTMRSGLERAAVRENGIIIVGLLWFGLFLIQHNRDRLTLWMNKPAVLLATPPFRALQLALVIVMHQNATS